MNATIRIYFWFGTSWASLIVNDNNIYIITVYIILYGTDYSTTQYCKLVRTSTYSARVCFRYGESRTIFIRCLSVESYGPLRRANSSLEEEDSRMVSYSFNIKKRTKRWFNFDGSVLLKIVVFFVFYLMCGLNMGSPPLFSTFSSFQKILIIVTMLITYCRKFVSKYWRSIKLRKLTEMELYRDVMQLFIDYITRNVCINVHHAWIAGIMHFSRFDGEK